MIVAATVIAAAAAVALGAVPAAATPPSPTPAPITEPGGLLPGAPAAGFGDCALPGVTCKPPGMSSSCTKYTSQTVPPSTIKVFVPSANPQIQTIAFPTYVENVLPNEWIASWDGDALKAGAVTVKSYAWYWVAHFGGYLTPVLV